MKEVPANTSLEEADFLRKFSVNIFIFAVFLIMLITALSFYQFNKLSRTNTWVTHSYEVILTANQSIYYYSYMSAKQREFMLFNDADAFQNYLLNVTEIDNTLKQLEKLTSDNPAQHKRVNNYIQLINDRINLYNKAIQLKKLGTYTPEIKNDLFNQGKIITSEIENIAQEIIDQERLLLEERNSKLVSEISFSNYIMLAAQALSIIFLLIAFFASRKQLKIRSAMETNTRNLTTQIKSLIESANDMIVALDNNYRYIIFNHGYHSEIKKLFGIDIQLGKSLEEVFADNKEIKIKLLEMWKRSLAGDNTTRILQFPKDNVLNTYEVTPSLIQAENGKTLGALHIIRNITERIKEQNQLKDSYEKLNAATEELKTKNEKITLLLEMSDILLVTNSLEEVNSVIPKYCNKILNFSSGNLYIMRPSKDILELSGQWGKPTSEIQIFTHNQCWALRLGRIHRSFLKPDDLLCPHVKVIQDRDVGYICLPLRAQNEVFGVLYIEYDIIDNKQLTDTEKLLINAFAEVIALALANIRLRENLRFQSIRDPLTNLYNRRYLEEVLTTQLFLAQREQIPLTVLMMDLDHFKRVNDVHGHDAGDIVLKEFSHLLSKFLRRSDLATRFGGEEFVVVLFNTDKKNGKAQADKIRETVTHLNIKYGNQDIHLSISVGVSSFPDNANDGKELIELADKALYAAKKNGRNQVIHYDELK